MVRNTAAIHVGRLLEVRADAGYRTVSEVDQLFELIQAELDKFPRIQRYITVVDWRRCPLMESRASERIVQRIVAQNPRTERSAALASRDSPVAVLQFMRLIRETQHPERRMFFEPDELSAWLREVLIDEEYARLQAFLAR
ncbi:MAG TPA: hypothetical protein VG963_18700 [Polyangiaceae bacterium]|nr:hypothetical protein [Polyangiaceae bacterium]